MDGRDICVFRRSGRWPCGRVVTLGHRHCLVQAILSGQRLSPRSGWLWDCQAFVWSLVVEPTGKRRMVLVCGESYGGGHLSARTDATADVAVCARGATDGHRHRAGAATHFAAFVFALVFALTLSQRVHAAKFERTETVQRQIMNEGLLRSPGMRLGRLLIVGNHAIRDAELRARISLVPRGWVVWAKGQGVSARQLREDAQRIENVYKRHGFFDAHVQSIRIFPGTASGSVDVEMRVHEGRRVCMASAATLAPGAPTLPVPILTKGQPFHESAFQGARARLQRALRDAGYYSARVTGHACVVPETYAAWVTYYAVSGARVRFGSVVVNGLVSVEDRVVQREIAWKPQEWYSQRKVDETIGNLYGLNLFRFVSLAPAFATGATNPMPMRLTVVEAKPQSFRVGLGYGTEDRFRLQARYAHFNFAGDGRQLRTTLRYSALLRCVEMSFLQPYFLTTRNAVSLTAEYRQQRILGAFSFERYAVAPRLSRRFNTRWSGYAGYVAQYNRAFDVLAPIPLTRRGQADPGVLSAITAGLDGNLNTDVRVPTRGVILNLKAMQAGVWLGGAFSFYRLQAEMRHYGSPWERWVFATRGKVGVADAIGRSRVPVYEKFYSGGDNSVRGYRQDRLGPAIGGQTLVEIGSELRRRIARRVWLLGFGEMGMVSLAAYAWSPDQVRWGVGPGIRAETPIGLAGFDLGVPLRPRTGEPRWRVHLSIGEVF